MQKTVVSVALAMNDATGVDEPGIFKDKDACLVGLVGTESQAPTFLKEYSKTFSVDSKITKLSDFFWRMSKIWPNPQVINRHFFEQCHTQKVSKNANFAFLSLQQSNGISANYAYQKNK